MAVSWPPYGFSSPLYGVNSPIVKHVRRFALHVWFTYHVGVGHKGNLKITERKFLSSFMMTQKIQKMAKIPYGYFSMKLKRAFAKI